MLTSTLTLILSGMFALAAFLTALVAYLKDKRKEKTLNDSGNGILKGQWGLNLPTNMREETEMISARAASWGFLKDAVKYHYAEFWLRYDIGFNAITLMDWEAGNL